MQPTLVNFPTPVEWITNGVTKSISFVGQVANNSNVIILMYLGSATHTLASISDTNLNNYGAPQTLQLTGGLTMYFWEVAQIAAGNNTVTVTFTPGHANPGTLIATEWSGLASASIVDDFSFNNGNDQGRNNSGYITTTQNGDLLIGACCCTTATVSSGSVGWHSTITSVNKFLFQYTILGNYGTFQSTGIATGGPWIAGAIALKAASPPATVNLLNTPIPTLPEFAVNQNAPPAGLVSIRPFDDTISNFNTDPGLTNPAISTILLRVGWGTTQSSPSLSDIDYSYIDNAFAVASLNNKLISMEFSSVSLDTGTPLWIFDLGCTSFTITTVGVVPPPWDPVFLTYWNNFLTALGERYSNNPILSYITIGGLSSSNTQTTFCKSCSDNAAMNAAAVQYGFPVADASGTNTATCSNAPAGSPVFIAAAQVVVGYHAVSFPTIPLIVAKGSFVFPQQQAPFFALSAELLSNYGKRIGLKDNAYSSTYSQTQPMFLEMQSLNQTNVVGFQENHPASILSDVTGEFLVDCGQWFIELYDGSINVSGVEPALQTEATLLANRVYGILHPTNDTITPIEPTYLQFPTGDVASQFLPEIVSEDPSFKAGIDQFTQALSIFGSQIGNLLIKPNFWKLPSDAINELAIEFRPPGYNADLPLYQRRQLILGANYANAHLGTPQSVQTLVNQLFGSAVVQEWWQYGGRPYRFRLLTPTPNINIDQLAILNQAILDTKPLSRWPDGLQRISGSAPASTSGSSQTYIGTAFFRVRNRTFTKVTVTIP